MKLKLERLSLANIFSLVYCLRIRLEPNKVEPFLNEGGSITCKLACFVNIGCFLQVIKCISFYLLASDIVTDEASLGL